ncbi:hypothetical protein RRG08_019345 [Elysia crispata]|uniref:Uncharacterized protein n=1 Tax=Elysia crispata TaxID=231223 RepID=A0AAE1E9P4_9GAST|nr:hypothetical protein RRG08_019345 [Elysia crispata]
MNCCLLEANRYTYTHLPATIFQKLGSKVRQSVVTPRSGGQTPRSGSLPGSDHQDHHQHLQQQQQQAHHAFPQSAHHQHVSESVGYPISPSPRPQSRRLNSRESRAPLEGKDENGLVRHYKWNLSEQGIRLQRQLSSLSSCRSIKRASEIVSHRLDPMYLMSGSKVALQNRYGIDEQDMRRLHEMTQIREGLLSDLKKMKFPYGARAPKHVVQRTHKHRPPTDDTPRIDGNEQSKASLGAAKPAPVHPSTPASDPPDDPANQQQDRRPPSEQTNDEESGRAETE